MKMNLKLCLATIACALTFVNSAQTPGSLTFTYTPVSHTGYSGTRNVLAIWIQSSSGTFIKTKVRYAGSQTKDHLPTWASNSGGTNGNCLSANCNVVSATTGATLTSFQPKTITWDGTDVNGNIVTDGTYKITIQSCWDHGTGGTTTRSFTFTKGNATDAQSPAADANFNTISLAWNPSGLSIEENKAVTSSMIYPNPSVTGNFTVEYEQAKEIQVIDLAGNKILTKALTQLSGTSELDLSTFSNGIYFVRLVNGQQTTEHKIIVDKQ